MKEIIYVNNLEEFQIAQSYMKINKLEEKVIIASSSVKVLFAPKSAGVTFWGLSLEDCYDDFINSEIDKMLIISSELRTEVLNLPVTCPMARIGYSDFSDLGKNIGMKAIYYPM